MSRVPNVVINAQFSTFAAPMVLRPDKVVKIRPKHFFAVLIGNDKNLSPKTVGMFLLLNRVIWPYFQLFLFRWFLGPKKSWNFFRDRFYPYDWETKRNASQIESVYFGFQNRVIRARFSTLPAPMCPRKFDRNNFYPYRWKMIKITHQKLCLCFGL